MKYVSSDFASKFLILENVSPAVDEVASMMNVKSCQEESRTQAPSLFTIPKTAISKTATTHATTVPPTISMITPLPQLTTPSPAPTTSTITESLENVVLAKSSSQPQSTYEAAASLTEFELKILLDKLEKSKSYRAAEDHRNLYNVLVKSYQLDKDLFDLYGKAYSLKRSQEDKDKDDDPPAGPDQRLKKWKKSKDAEPPRSSKSKDSQSSSSKGTKSQPKSYAKSLQAEEPVFETADTEMPQDQGDDIGNTEDQPNVEAASKHDWFKKPEWPLTPDLD
ncbi:hypothetical protein Tco_1278782 [Tanacetum coccineum]